MLTDKAIQAAKPSARPYKLADGRRARRPRLAKPNGSKLWRFRIIVTTGARRCWDSAPIPTPARSSLREKRDKGAQAIGGGLGPEAVPGKLSKLLAQILLKRSRASGCLCRRKRLAPATYAKAEWTSETLVFPAYISGPRPYRIKSQRPDVLKVLKRIEGDAVFTETAHRAPGSRISQVCRGAVGDGAGSTRCDLEPARRLSAGRDALITPPSLSPPKSASCCSQLRATKVRP